MTRFNFELDEEDYIKLMSQKPKGLKKNTFARIKLLEALYSDKLKSEGERSAEHPPLSYVARLTSWTGGSHAVF